MKKTLIININGIIFNIDEDAFEKLQIYLDELKRYFVNIPEGNEIIEDIEARIAELMQPKISEARQSINIDDIFEIIGVLGEPKDIAGADAGDEQFENDNTQKETKSARKTNRRLYRDSDNAVIGGVCSGIGAYFNLDPVAVRIIFIVLTMAAFISFLIYPILWFVIPIASTASQKLEMRGESVTISNLEKALHEEFKQVKQNIKRLDTSSIGYKLNTLFKSIIELIYKIFSAIWSIFKFLLGIFLIGFSIFLIIVMIGSLYFNSFIMDNHHFIQNNFSSVEEYLKYIISPFMADFLIVLAIFIILLPVIGMIYAGLKLLIRFQAKDKWIKLSLSVIWVICIFTFVSVLISEISNFKKEERIKELVTLSPVKQNILYVNMLSKNENDVNLQDWPDENLYNLIKNGNSKLLVGKVRLDIEKTLNTSAELLIIRSARGNTNDDAISDAKNIKINYSQNDSVLNLDPLFTVTSNLKWKFQSVHFVLRIPVGMKLFLNSNTKAIVNNFENAEDNWSREITSHTLQMTDKGLDAISFSNSSISTIALPENRIINIQIRDHYSISKEDWRKIRDSRKYGSLFENSNKINYGIIDFDIKKSEDEHFKLEIIKTALGSSSTDASSTVQKVEYNWEQKDSIIWFDPIFRFPIDVKPNDQQVKVILRIPLHRKIFLSRDMKFFAANIQGLDIDYDDNNDTWTMTNDGISKNNDKKDSE